MRVHQLALLLLVLPVFGSCGGGGGGGGSGGSVASNFLVTDAPVDDLLAFAAIIDEVRLVRTNGNQTGNLLTGPVATEFLGLQGTAAWVAHAVPPEGEYSAVRLSLQPGSVRATDKGGADVPVNVVGNVLTAAFPATVTMGGSRYRRVLIDLDLSSSLSGAVSSPPIVFDPRGSSFDDDGSSSAGIDEIKGIVTAADPAASSLTLDAFVDDDLLVSLGQVNVTVPDSTLLLDDNGLQFPSKAAFFSSLTAGITLLEVHGQLLNGRVQATRIEIEDHSGGSGSSNKVKIEGLVTAHTPGFGFELVIREIEKGSSIAVPVLNTLGNPTTISVSYDANTLFFQGSKTLTSSSALAIGQEVKVKFPSFVNPPFHASQVELEDGPEFEGSITDTSGLPTSLIMHVSSSEPSVSSGQIASSSTDVFVDLTSSTLFIDTEGKPSVDKNRLLPGLKIEAHGTLTGPPSGPTITATKTKIHAGRLRGTVLSATPGMSSFMVSLDDLKDPFGNTVVSPPFRVDLLPETVFKDEARSEQEFFALFANLKPGQVLTLEVEGIGSGFANEILAYEIESEVEN